MGEGKVVAVAALTSALFLSRLQLSAVQTCADGQVPLRPGVPGHVLSPRAEEEAGSRAPAHP